MSTLTRWHARFTMALLHMVTLACAFYHGPATLYTPNWLVLVRFHHKKLHMKL